MYISRNDKTAKELAKMTGYNGHRFQVVVSPVVSVGGRYWDEGYKNTFYFVDMETMDNVQFPESHPMYSPDGRDGEYVLPENRGIVLHRQGQYPEVTLYVRPDAANLVEQKPENLTWAERVVLQSFDYKSSYAGVPNYRFYEAHRATGITTQEYDAAKAALMGRSYIDKRGALTITGKNIRANERLHGIEWPTK